MRSIVPAGRAQRVFRAWDRKPLVRTLRATRPRIVRGDPVPRGPREGRTAEQAGLQTHAVLPLRMSKEMVELVDETWRAKGIKSRMEFFRLASGKQVKGMA